MAEFQKDVFVSYSRTDAEWVRVLSENLYQSGLEVFFDEWEIGPGDVLVHKLDAGILASRNGVLVVSPSSLSRPWVQQEYAAMMTRVVEGKQQNLIPVLLKDAEMPPFLTARLWIDFRNVDGPDYLSRVAELVRALKGERLGPPPRTGELKPPPGSGFQATGTQSFGLSIDPTKTVLTGTGVDVADPPPEPHFDGDMLKWALDQARRHSGPVRDEAAGAVAHAGLETTLEDVGGRLAKAYLPTNVAGALTAAITEAERLNNTLQLALGVAQPLSDLPWETLSLPGIGALTLHPRIALFRRVKTPGPAAAVSIPGPLRILVAIGSPEAQNSRGELLDMEAETQRILDAAEAAKKVGKDVFVRILEEGSVAAIHEALSERRYHILHISCHANETELILEDARGKEDRTTAERLWKEAIPAEKSPALVVLAGCSTGREGAAGNKAGEAQLPGLARALVQHGVPAVVAMQASVSDKYATELMGEVYGALSSWNEPQTLAALSHARRKLEIERRKDISPLRPPPEWATPALLCAATPLSLYDPKAPFEALKQPPQPVLDPGVVVRRVGDMVGRRSEQRQLLSRLRDPDGAGVLIHGIGGVGKSTLVAQILHRLASEDGLLLISVAGETDPERVLSTIATRLLSLCLTERFDENHPLRQLAGIVGEPKHPWRARLDLLAQNLLSNVPVAFLFDNFESNLKDGAPPEQLGEMIAHWLRAPGKSRLLFTSRYPFNLPDDAQERLNAFPLGPLSWAETRKLFWRLDGIKTLGGQDQRRAYEEVGGHPRALEYFDAILRGGKARFDDVQARIRKQLKAKGITDPSRWCADTAGGFDAALAATVTLAADDVLLDELLAALDDQPLAKRLVFMTSVYRVPVDEIGLSWLVGELIELPPDPARDARIRDVRDRLNEAQKTNPAATLADVLTQVEGLQWEADMATAARPPIAAPAELEAVRQRLIDLSLLACVRSTEDNPERFLVHRWTAAALAKRMSPEEAKAAHDAAAAYWLWRRAKLPQSPEQDIADLLEARHHLLETGDKARFYDVSSCIIVQLDTWGAWDWEESLVHETLAQMAGFKKEEAALFHQLGIVAHNRGDYDAALGWYRKSLALLEQLGDRAGMTASYHQLGTIATSRGDYDAALDWCRKSLAIKEQLGDRAGMARSYHQLGIDAHNRGDYDAALDWYRKSLAITEQLGDRAGMAGSYHQLGLVAELRGDYDSALDWYRKSLAIQEQLGDRAGMAGSYHQLGLVAQRRGDYDAALDWYLKSVKISEQLGDRSRIAASYHQLGTVVQYRGDDDAALDWYRKSLAILEQLSDRIGMAASYHQLGTVAQRRGDYDAVLDWYRKSLAVAEQLGDRAGVAQSFGQMAVLSLKTGMPQEAVSLTLQSLAIHLELQSPEVARDLHFLSDERRTLGTANFNATLAECLEPESARNLIDMIDRAEQNRKQS